MHAGSFLAGMVFGGALAMTVVFFFKLDDRTHSARWFGLAVSVLLLAGAGANLWNFTHPPSRCPAVIYLHGTGTVTVPGCRTVLRR